MISIQLISKKYGNRPILSDLNMKLKEGEVHGVVGKNGSGKSTLFRCLAGLEQFEGTINMDGHGSAKNRMGFLPTSPPILSKITGKEYLTLMCKARNVRSNDIEKRNVFDLPLNNYIEHYSTGMTKKLALTGVLIQENKIFVLDEPFNGLDYESNVFLSHIIHELKSLNKIVLLSSHIFSTLSETCDYIHHLDQGTIVESVGRPQFQEMESAMKKKLVESKIDQLSLH